MDKPLRIAYIMSRFPRLTETFVLYEMLALHRLGFQVFVMPLQCRREKVVHPETAGMQVAVLDAPWLSVRTLAVNLRWFLRHPIRYLSAWLRALVATLGNAKFFLGAVLFFPKAVVFADLALRHRIGYVHAHFASHPALAAWVIHRLAGIPYSFTAHGTDIHVCRRMLPEKTRDAAFAITVSEYNREFIAEHCGAEIAGRFEVIRCGVDMEVFTPAQAAAGGDRMKIVCIAAFREVKGHRYLLDACALLRDRGVNFECRLVGGGPLEKTIRRRIRDLQLSSRVRVEGLKARPEVVRLLQGADLMVLSSVQTRSGSREGIPVALMEAMACGVPVVASRISGIPELVEDGVSGCLVEPRAAHAIAEAIVRMAADPEWRRRLGANGRLRVAEAFDLSKNVECLSRRIRAGYDRDRAENRV